MNDLSLEVKAKGAHEAATAYFKIAEQYGYKFIMEVKKIRDERYYKQLGYSSFDDYCKTAWNIDRDFMNERIKIAEEFGSSFDGTYRQLGHTKSLLLARMGTAKEFMEQKHTIPSSGEQKTVDEMTVRELKEVKRALEKEKKAKEKAEKQAALLQKELEKEKAKQPEIIEKEVVREVVPPEIEKKLKEDQLIISAMKQEYEAMKEKIRQLELENVEDFDEKMMIAKQRKLEKEAEINVLELRVAIKQFMEKVPFTPFMQGAIAMANPATKKRLEESVKGMRVFVEQLEAALRSEIVLKEAQIIK